MIPVTEQISVCINSSNRSRAMPILLLPVGIRRGDAACCSGGCPSNRWHLLQHASRVVQLGAYPEPETRSALCRICCFAHAWNCLENCFLGHKRLLPSDSYREQVHADAPAFYHFFYMHRLRRWHHSRRANWLFSDRTTLGGRSVDQAATGPCVAPESKGRGCPRPRCSLRGCSRLFIGRLCDCVPLLWHLPLASSSVTKSEDDLSSLQSTASRTGRNASGDGKQAEYQEHQQLMALGFYFS
jgi:hypothetical protein